MSFKFCFKNSAFGENFSKFVSFAADTQKKIKREKNSKILSVLKSEKSNLQFISKKRIQFKLFSFSFYIWKEKIQNLPVQF